MMMMMMIPFSVTSLEKEQISLPSRLGGLAVGDLVQYTCTAKLQRMMEMRDNPNLKRILDVRIINKYSAINDFELNNMLNEYNSYVDSKYYITDINKKYTLKEMILKINENKFNILFNKSELRNKIILNSCKYNKFSNAYIRTIPSNIRGVFFSNKMYEVILKRRLGRKLINNDNNNIKCTECNQTCDAYGDHALKCKHGKGRIYRHDMIVKEIYNDLIKLDFNCKLEPSNLLRGNNLYRPADIKVANFHNGKEYWIDLGITNTNYQGSYNKDVLNKNAISYEKDKINKYQNEMNDLSDEQIYYPIIMQENGIINDNFNVVVNKITKVAAKNMIE